MLASPDDGAFHALRKWSKYLWYQTRILERANRPVLRTQRVRLQVLGEILGHAHDIAVLETGAHIRVENEVIRAARDQKRRLYRRALALAGVLFSMSAERQVADLGVAWARWRSA